MSTKVKRTSTSSDAPIMMISAASGFINQSDKYSRENAGQSLKKYTLLKKGELAYNHGASKLRTYGCCFELTIDKARIPYVYHTFKINSKQYTSYIAILLNNPIIDRQLMRIVSSSARMDGLLNITYENYMNIKLKIPQYAEQKKIANFFSVIERKIEKQYQLIDLLKSYKRGLLSRLFPKNGATVPELRFKKFTDDWEQRKVTELGEIYIGLVTTMTSHYTDHGVLLIRNSDVKDSRFEFSNDPIYLDYDFAKQNASRRHRIGDVITVHTGDIGTSAVITEKEAGSIGFATIVTRPYKDKITSEYLCAYLNTDTHKNFAMNISTGDGRNNYNLKDYYECVVPVPSIAEQIQISECINNLNNLITLHQEKWELYVKIKNALLQKMFI